MKQKTITNSFALQGVGLHTGKLVNIKVKPAEADFGIRFQRVDLESKPEIMADASRVTKTERGTVLEENGASISTIEHLLSAAQALDIDNLLVEVEGPEIPILDGSAGPFYQQFLQSIPVDQDATAKYLEITQPIHWKDENTGTEFSMVPADCLTATVLIDFNSPTLGTQFAEFGTETDYGKEIADSRTFVFLHELEGLYDKGLIRGGSLDNAIVIVDRLLSTEELEKLSKKLGYENLYVDKEGILSNTSLKFPNEPARHKLLDVLGDLKLTGFRIKGKIVAKKPGHTSNVEFAKYLKQLYKEYKKKLGVPSYDPNQAPVKDINQILQMLPHRFPFVMVDKVTSMSENCIIGIKNIGFNEYFFQGHFPNNPVFPGVLQIEAMAQTGGILALSTVPDPENWDTYFLKIDNAKFKKKVLPGDTLIIKMEMVSPIRRGLCHMLGRAYVGDELVSEAELMAQIINRTKIGNA
jgi:UDP-3-O-[3-hydroxymyristoyl] N-acetylglucosamine deacetylase / 3-hydroxyacyl-[acyl-carrier-protein] dehydratase